MKFKYIILFLGMTIMGFLYSSEFPDTKHILAYQRRKALEEQRIKRLFFTSYEKQLRADLNRRKQYLMNCKKRGSDLGIEFELLRLGCLTNFSLYIHNCLHEPKKADNVKRLFLHYGFDPSKDLSCNQWISSIKDTDDQEIMYSNLLKYLSKIEYL